MVLDRHCQKRKTFYFNRKRKTCPLSEYHMVTLLLNYSQYTLHNSIHPLIIYITYPLFSMIWQKKTSIVAKWKLIQHTFSSSYSDLRKFAHTFHSATTFFFINIPRTSSISNIFGILFRMFIIYRFFKYVPVMNHRLRDTKCFIVNGNDGSPF